MSLTCNLDSRGKLLRMISGIVLCIAGLWLVFGWAMPNGGWLPWLVSLLTIVFGGFQIFEGWAGWCVVRAMGFKTPI